MILTERLRENMMILSFKNHEINDSYLFWNERLNTLSSGVMGSCENGSFEAFDIDVSCADCINPQAEFTTVSDCDNNPQFLVEVDLTDLGSGSEVIITDNQGNPAQTESSVGTYTFGPYENGTPVEITVENGDDANCSFSSDTLTEEYCSELNVDCTAGPVNSVICYEAGESVEVSFIGNDPDEVLNLTVNSALVSTFGDGLTVYDSDGTTILYQGTGENGDLSGISVQSTGNEISYTYQPSSVYGCGEFGYTALDISVACATCVSPEADFTSYSDCENGEEFLIDVDLTDLGSADDVDIMDDQGNPAQTASSTGIYTFGPYDNNTPVKISIENNQDTNCSIVSNTLTEEYCTDVPIACEAGETNFVYCYDDFETTAVTYTADDPDAVLNFTVNSGMIYSLGGNFIVYDTDGTILYDDQGESGDLSDLSFQSSGDEISFSYEAGSWGCGESSYTALDLTVECSTCTDPEAEFNVISDCESGTEQFLIEVDITDLGTADSLDINDDQGSDTETVSETGMVTFGPYPNSTAVIISVENTDDIGCNVISDPLTQTTCEPDNSYCEEAITAAVNDSYECDITTPGTLASASPSINDDSLCGSGANDVWFKFTAQAETHVVSLENVDDFLNTRFALYEGDECSELNLMECGGPGINSKAMHDLTIGDTYYIRVFTDNNDTDTGFDVCIVTPAQPIGTDTEIYTVEELVTDVLINSACAPVSNISYTTGTNYGDVNGIGYFTDNNSTFPHEAGIILSTGDANNAPGPRRPGSDGTLAWEGDPDITELIQQIDGNPESQSYNASVIEFDFIPFDDHISFDYLFASEEYGIYQCDFSDTFAFFLTDQDGNTTNLAVVPNTDTPVSVTTIRDGAYNAGCGSENEEYFDEYYEDGVGLPEFSNPINFRGYTTLLTAEADVTPGQTYHIKLAIADRNDEDYDSAVFLLADSFSLGDLDLGEDITIENGNAPCEAESITLDSQIEDATDAEITWYKESEELEGENGTTLEVTESGEYTITVIYGGSCVLSDEITVEFAPLPEFEFEDQVYSLCGSDGVILDGTPINEEELSGMTYAWLDTDDEVIPGENESTYETDQEGFYTVEVTSEYGCVNTHTFEVIDGEFTIDLGEDQLLCDINNFEITAEVLGIDPSEATYEWEGPEGTLEQTGSTINVSDSGLYTVYVAIGECVGESSITLEFNESPVFDLGEDLATGDLNGVELDATPTNIDPDTANYEWDYNGNPIPENGPIVYPIDYGYGVYTVTVFGDDPDCDATQSISITEEEIICSVSIDADAQLSNTLQYCENETLPSYEITLQANFEVENASPENVNFTWFKNGEEIANATASTYTVNYDEQGDFDDEFTVEAEIEGCVATATVSTEISIMPYEHPCKITEGISPGNNDGLNDYLDLTFLNDRSGIAELIVYNRYGVKVYSEANYVNSWHGQDKDGDELATGTYYYVLKMKNEDPVFGRVKKGWIYVNQKTN